MSPEVWLRTGLRALPAARPVHHQFRHARAEATASRLFAEQDWDVTCAVGRDERLRLRLTERAAGRRRPAQSSAGRTGSPNCS